MKEYLSANESAMNEAASYDPDDIFFLWDDIVDNDREGIEKGYTKVGSKKAEQFNFDTDAPNFDKFRRELVALLKKNGWKHDIIGNDYSGLNIYESAMNEAASYDPDDIFFLWDDIVDNDREGIEKGYTKVGSKKAEQFNFDTDAPNFDKFRRELVALLKKNGWKHDIIGNDYSGLNIYESAMNEAEVKSDEEFKEYAFAVLKKAFGEEFDEAKAQEVIDGILGKVDGDYGAAVGMLTSSLG